MGPGLTRGIAIHVIPVPLDMTCHLGLRHSCVSYMAFVQLRYNVVRHNGQHTAAASYVYPMNA